MAAPGWQPLRPRAAAALARAAILLVSLAAAPPSAAQLPGCSMTYMWPNYLPVPVPGPKNFHGDGAGDPHSDTVSGPGPQEKKSRGASWPCPPVCPRGAHGVGRYRLLLYQEGEKPSVHPGGALGPLLKGQPVLFVPGNGGCHKQVRSLASVSHHLHRVEAWEEMWGGAQVGQGRGKEEEEEETEGEEEEEEGEEEEWQATEEERSGAEDTELGGGDGPGVTRRSTQPHGRGAPGAAPGHTRGAPRGPVGLDWFTVDLGEELSAFDSLLLTEQALFVARAVKTILGLYLRQDGGSGPGRSIILVGHSMGGLVCRAATAQHLCGPGGGTRGQGHSPNASAACPVALLLTLASPHSAPPFGLQPSMVSLYESVQQAEADMAHRAWCTTGTRSSPLPTPCGVPPVISVSSGWRDWQVRSWVGRMPWQPFAGRKAWGDGCAPQHSVPGQRAKQAAQEGGCRGSSASGPLRLHFHSSAVPGAWVLPDHQSIVWCNQLVGKLSQGLLDLARRLPAQDSSTRTITGTSKGTGTRRSSTGSVQDKGPTSSSTTSSRSSSGDCFRSRRAKCLQHQKWVTAPLVRQLRSGLGRRLRRFLAPPTDFHSLYQHAAAHAAALHSTAEEDNPADETGVSDARQMKTVQGPEEVPSYDVSMDEACRRCVGAPAEESAAGAQARGPCTVHNGSNPIVLGGEGVRGTTHCFPLQRAHTNIRKGSEDSPEGTKPRGGNGGGGEGEARGRQGHRGRHAWRASQRLPPQTFVLLTNLQRGTEISVYLTHCAPHTPSSDGEGSPGVQSSVPGCANASESQGATAEMPDSQDNALKPFRGQDGKEPLSTKAGKGSGVMAPKQARDITWMAAPLPPLQGEGDVRQLGMQPQASPSLLLLLSQEDLRGHCAIAVMIRANASKAVPPMGTQREPFLSMQRMMLVPGQGAGSKPRALSLWRHLVSPIAPYALPLVGARAAAAHEETRGKGPGGTRAGGVDDSKRQEGSEAERVSQEAHASRVGILQAVEVPWSTAPLPLKLTLRRWHAKPSADQPTGGPSAPTGHHSPRAAAPPGAYVLLLTPPSEGGDALAVPLYGFRRAPPSARGSPSTEASRQRKSESEGKKEGEGEGEGAEVEAVQVTVSWDGLPPAPGRKWPRPPPHLSTLLLVLADPGVHTEVQLSLPLLTALKQTLLLCYAPILAAMLPAALCALALVLSSPPPHHPPPSLPSSSESVHRKSRTPQAPAPQPPVAPSWSLSKPPSMHPSGSPWAPNPAPLPPPPSPLPPPPPGPREPLSFPRAVLRSSFFTPSAALSLLFSALWVLFIALTDPTLRLLPSGPGNGGREEGVGEGRGFWGKGQPGQPGAVGELVSLLVPLLVFLGASRSAAALLLCLLGLTAEGVCATGRWLLARSLALRSSGGKEQAPRAARSVVHTSEGQGMRRSANGAQESDPNSTAPPGAVYGAYVGPTGTCLAGPQPLTHPALAGAGSVPRAPLVLRGHLVGLALAGLCALAHPALGALAGMALLLGRCPGPDPTVLGSSEWEERRFRMHYARTRAALVSTLLVLLVQSAPSLLARVKAGALYLPSPSDGGTVLAFLGLWVSSLIHFSMRSTASSSIASAEPCLYGRVVPLCLQCAAVLCSTLVQSSLP